MHWFHWSIWVPKDWLGNWNFGSLRLRQWVNLSPSKEIYLSGPCRPFKYHVVQKTMENNFINFCSYLLMLSLIFLGSLHLQQGADRNPQASLVWAHQESVITSVWSVILLFFSDLNPAFLSGKFRLILPVFRNRIRIRRILKFWTSRIWIFSTDPDPSINKQKN